jgi:aryl-alcohol dehydrogenase-like predicted oxidoreductase
MAKLALPFILSNPEFKPVIPGMRRPELLAATVAAAEAGPLPDELLTALRGHRWDRAPSRASQS